MAPVRDNFLLLLVGLFGAHITAPPQAKTISAVTARVGTFHVTYLSSYPHRREFLAL